MKHPIKSFLATFGIILIVNYLAEILPLFYLSNAISHIPYTQVLHRLSHPTVLDRTVSWTAHIFYFLAYLLAGFIAVRIEKRKLRRHGLGFGLFLVAFFTIFMAVGTLLTINSRMSHDRSNTAIYQKQEHNIIVSYYPFNFGELFYLGLPVLLMMAGVTLAERRLSQKKTRPKAR